MLDKDSILNPPRQAAMQEMQTRDTQCAKDAGFTLVEIVVVIVIAGILVAVGVSSFTSLVRKSSYDDLYNQTLASFNKCRGSAIVSPYPTTQPTAIALFPNGVSCFVWNDLNNDRSFVFTASEDADSDGEPDAGEGEVREVLFTIRYDPKETINGTGSLMQIDLAGSTLPTGNFFIIPSAGFFQTGRRTLQVATVKVNGPWPAPQRFTLYPSGQIE